MNLGEAYVDLLPDMSRFVPTMRTELTAALRSTSVDVPVHADTSSLKRELSKAGKESGEALGEGITRGADGKLRDAQGRFVASGGALGRQFSSGFDGGMKDFFKSAAKLAVVGLAVRQVSKGFPDLSFGVEGATRKTVLLTGALTAATAAATPLAAVATGGLLALGPALAAGAVGAGTLALAFQGIGGALTGLKAARQTAGADAAAHAAKESAAASAITSAMQGVSDARRAVQSARQAGAESIRSALDTERQAEYDLTRAQEDSLRAQEELTQAREDARRSLQDMNFDVREGVLREKEARLQLIDARQRLAETNADPTSSQNDRARALIDYQQQQLALEELSVRNKRLGKDSAEANKAGVKGSEQVLSAQEAIRAAQRGEAEAQGRLADAARGVGRARVESAQNIAQAEDRLAAAVDKVSEAQKAYGEAVKSTSASQAALNTALAGAGVEGAKFARFLDGLRGKLGILQAAAQGGFLPGLTAGIRALLPAMPNVVNLLKGTSDALGDMAESAGQFLGGPEGRGFIDFLAKTSPPLLKQFGEMTRNLTAGLFAMLPALMPLTNILTNSLVTLTEQFEKFSSGNRLVAFSDYIISMLPQVSATLGGLVGLIGSLVKAALPLGGPVLDFITGLANELSNLFSSPDFSGFVDNIGGILTALGPLVREVVPIIGQVAKALSGQLLAILPDLVPVIILFAQALGDTIIGLSPLLPSLVGLVGALVPLLPALYPIVTIIRTGLIPVVELLTDGVELLVPYVGQLVGALAAATVPSGRFASALDKVKDAMSGVGSAFTGYYNVVVPIAVAIGGALVGAFRDNLPAIRGALAEGRGVIKGALEFIQVLILRITQIIAFIWKNFGDEIMAVIRIVFRTVVAVVKGALGILRGVLKVATSILKGDWRGAWDGIKDILRNAWDIIKAIVKGALGIIKVTFWAGLKYMISKAGDFLGYMGGKFKNGFAKVTGYITRPIDSAKDKLRDMLGDMVELFARAVVRIGSALDGVKSKAAKPINFVIGTVYNDGIRKALNLIPGVNFAKANLIGSGGGSANTTGLSARELTRASGGVLPGWSPGRDIHHFVSPTGGRLALSGGEAIMRPEFTEAVGGEKGVAELNARARKGMAFAAGGVVWPTRGRRTGTYPGHDGVDINRGSGNQDLGDPIYAFRDGTITHAGYGRGYGNAVFQSTSAGNVVYGHGSRVLVKPGQSVKAGDQIAKVGNTGNSSAAHLHFGIPGGTYSQAMGLLRGASYKGGGGGAIIEAIQNFIGSPTEKILSGLKAKMTSGISSLPFGKEAISAGSAGITAALAYAKKAPSAAWNAITEQLGATTNYTSTGGDQLANAATIASVGSGMGKRAQQIGIATAIVESGLRNLTYGDRDSVGLFQQRAPWGSFAARTNPRVSAGMFFHGGQGGQRGLDDIPGWRSMNMGRAAQAVQVSAFPGRYSQEMGKAASIMGQLKPALAKGGIVRARSGGTDVTVGEGGRDEAVVPLPKGWDAPRTIRAQVPIILDLGAGITQRIELAMDDAGEWSATMDRMGRTR